MDHLKTNKTSLLVNSCLNNDYSNINVNKLHNQLKQQKNELMSVLARLPTHKEHQRKRLENNADYINSLIDHVSHLVDDVIS